MLIMLQTGAVLPIGQHTQHQCMGLFSCPRGDLIRSELCSAEEDDTQACKFTEKVMNAQNAGAQGVSIIVALLCCPTGEKVLCVQHSNAHIRPSIYLCISVSELFMDFPLCCNL